jgi:phenylacetate-CoA ligase
MDLSRLRKRMTTGTSGEPLAIRKTTAEARLLRLYYFQTFRSLGVRRGELAARVRLSRPGDPEPPEKPLRKLANYLRLYPRADIIAETSTFALNEFKRLTPGIIGGTPGRLSLFVSQWSEPDKAHVRNAPWPRLVIVGGERLSTSVRSHLGEVFNARVLDMYSSTEFNLIASECPSTGAYHVTDETVALEILDGDTIVAPGGIGQPVGTALHSFASPLIRYPLGDLVTRGSNRCDCGATLSTIENIQGRLLNLLVLPQGMLFNDAKILEAVAYSSPWVRQVQVFQPQTDALTVRIAPLRDPTEEEVEHVRTYLEAFLGNLVTVDVVIDWGLGRHEGEKFRSVVRPDGAPI